jgi:predicted amino acid-binding ACT domain protein
MITVATSLLWVLLIIFSVSAIYSLKDIRLDIGRPQTTIAPQNELLVDFPIGIVNNGYYNLNDFNISMEIHDVQKTVMAQGFTFIPVIKKDETLNTTNRMRMNLTDILQVYQNLILNDTELQINTTVSMKAAGLISLQVSSNLTLAWGAPLYNLTLEKPKFTVQVAPNSTNYVRVTILTTFENHAFFDLNGTIHVSMYNNRNIFTSTGSIVFKAPQQSSYHVDLGLDVPVTDTTSNGYFDIFFSTPFFSYGPLVIPYGE